MKKLFVLINNEAGFLFPYLLFIIMIAFLSVSATISIYHEEIDLTTSHIEQLKIDTLIQRAYTQFKADYPIFELAHEELIYTFHDGEVKLTYTVLDDERVNIYFFVETDQKAIYSTSKKIPRPSAD